MYIYSSKVYLSYKSESMGYICKLDKDNGITHEDDACFGSSKFMIREATFLPYISALLWTIRANKNWGTDIPMLPLHYEKLSKGKVCATVEVFI